MTKRKEPYIYVGVVQREIIPYDIYRYDLIFLDITQYEIGKWFRKFNLHTKICFLKQRNQNIDENMDCHPFAFIDKPIHMKQVYHLMDDVLLYKNGDFCYLSVHIDTILGLLPVSLDNILYLVCLETEHGKSVYLQTFDRKYELRKNTKIKLLYNYFHEYGFEVPHESFLINLYNVQSIKGYDITMLNGDVLPLSQRKSTKVRKVYNEYKRYAKVLKS